MGEAAFHPGLDGESAAIRFVAAGARPRFGRETSQARDVRSDGIRQLVQYGSERFVRAIMFIHPRLAVEIFEERIVLLERAADAEAVDQFFGVARVGRNLVDVPLLRFTLDLLAGRGFDGFAEATRGVLVAIEQALTIFQ